MKKPFAKILIFIMIVLISGMAVFLMRNEILTAAGRWLVVRTPPRRADVIYVFAGGVSERPAYGAELFKRGYAPRVAVAGVLISYDLLAFGKVVNEGEINRKVLLRHGVPAGKIIQIWRGTSTMEEVTALKKLMNSNGWKSAILVSSPFHTRRIRFSVKKVFGNGDYRFSYVPTPHPIIRPDSWWREEEGLIMVSNEYLKLIYYHLKF